MNENIKEIVNIIGNAELSNKCHKECFINTDFDNECTLCRLATALHKAGYRKQSETVKEFAKKLLYPLIKAYNQSYKASGYDMEAALGASEIKHYIDHIKQTAEQFGKEE